MKKKSLKQKQKTGFRYKLQIKKKKDIFTANIQANWKTNTFT